MTQHILTYSTLIAIIWILVKSHGSEREEEKKPVAVKPRAVVVRNKAKRRRLRKALR